MKKNLLFIIGLFILFPMLVNANQITGNQTYNQTITVANVQAPVYDVYIEWDGLTFDWAYDYQTREYGWASYGSNCRATNLRKTQGFITVDDPQTPEGYFTDSNCTNFIDVDELPDGTYSYYGLYRTDSYIYVGDFSTGGYIRPSITWNPTSKYSYTTAEFSYEKHACELVSKERMEEIVYNYGGYEFYTAPDCNSDSGLNVDADNYDSNINYYGDPDMGFGSFSGGFLPDEARMMTGEGCDLNGCSASYGYNIHLFLGVDKSKTVVTPTPGDTIGSITLLITTN